MNKYIITISERRTYRFIIEADSQEEADTADEWAEWDNRDLDECTASVIVAELIEDLESKGE